MQSGLNLVKFFLIDFSDKISNCFLFLKINSDEFQKKWIDHFNKLDSEIPHGELGINPGIMSISEKIEIVQIFGEVSKKSN